MAHVVSSVPLYDSERRSSSAHTACLRRARLAVGKGRLMPRAELAPQPRSSSRFIGRVAPALARSLRLSGAERASGDRVGGMLRPAGRVPKVRPPLRRST
jgi:hypothetical protein